VWKPDAERLARELEVDQFFANTGRIWAFDERELQGGYVIDFDGAKMTWLGEMDGTTSPGTGESPSIAAGEASLSPPGG
jgi:hypothetical protein